MTKLEKKYNPLDSEKKWQKYWEDNGIYKFDWKDTIREHIYSIDTPPPTVSGTLHMGHISSFTHTDFIARFWRMYGKNVYYPIGFDDNGLPTERYVEKQKGIKGKEMPRNEFIKICQDTIKKAEDVDFSNLFHSVSHSYDWTLKYQTISKHSSHIAQLSFIDLYNKGALYRKDEPCIWDVIDQTALAQTEIEDKELESQKNYLKFGIKNKECGTIIDYTNETTTAVDISEHYSFVKNGNLDEVQNKVKETLQNFINEKRIFNTLNKEYKIQITQENRKHIMESNVFGIIKKNQLNRQRITLITLDKILSNSFLVQRDIPVDLTKNTSKITLEHKKTIQSYQKFHSVIKIQNNLYIVSITTELKNNTKDKNVFDLYDITLGVLYEYTKKEFPLVGTRPLLENSNLPISINDIILFVKQKKFIEIMTTRPELLPACVGLICHPSLYSKYKDKNAITPMGVEVPIIPDEKADLEKGTGFVMCCTFGDQTDIEWWKKYNMELRICLNEKGQIKLDNAKNLIEPEYLCLEGMKITDAREKILELLKENDKITRTPEKITHPVKVGERSKFPIEFLIKKQWNIKVLNIKDELHKKTDEVIWHPDWMKARMHDWINGLSWDWTISRQRFSGIALPVWYSKRTGEEGKVIVAEVEQLPIDPLIDLPKGYTRDEVIGDADVLDTWFTSAVSPQLNSHGITKELFVNKERFEKLPIPFDLRPQAHEIIRTWAFCTLVKSYYHENKIPWNNIAISGWCLASDGNKMSKSLGNIVDPVKIIAQKGSDAMRYWASKSTFGVDMSYNDNQINIGQKLITKLFNSAKFCEMCFENLEHKKTTPRHLSPLTKRVDALILSNKKINVNKNNIFKERLRQFLSNKEKYLPQNTIGNYKIDFSTSKQYIRHFIRGNDYNSIGKNKLLLKENIFENLQEILLSNAEIIGEKVDEKHKDIKKWIYLKVKNIQIENAAYNIVFDTMQLKDTPNDVCYLYDFKIFKQNIINVNKKTAKNDLQITETIDKWLLNRMQNTIKNATNSFKEYEFNKAIQTTEQFFWNDFCDNYLEIVKVRCYGASGFKYKDQQLSQEQIEKINTEQQSALHTIYYVFNALLKLFAPFIPAICDEIYSCLYEDEFNTFKSISARGNWVNADNFAINGNFEKIGDLALNIIAEARKYKAEKNISIKEITPSVTIYTNETIDNSTLEDLKNVCNINAFIIKDGEFKVEF